MAAGLKAVFSDGKGEVADALTIRAMIRIVYVGAGIGLLFGAVELLATTEIFVLSESIGTLALTFVYATLISECLLRPAAMRIELNFADETVRYPIAQARSKEAL